MARWSVIPIENDEELAEAKEYLHNLEVAEAGAPGWLVEESGLGQVLARVERAIDNYNRGAE